MTDKKDTPSSDAGAPKRPHATLDLKATEVKAAGAASSAAAAGQADATPGSAQSASAGAAGAKPGAPASAGASTASSSAKASGGSGGPSSDKNNGKATSPNKPAAPSRLGRLVSTLAAGVIGGGVVLLSGDRLPALLGMPAPNAELEQTVATLEARLAAAESAAKPEAPDALTAVTEKIARLEAAAAEVEALKSAQAQLTEEAKALAATVASGTENDRTATRLGKLESQLTTLESAASSEDGGGRIAQLAALTGKIADVEAALGGQIAALRESVPQDIERRLALAGDASEAAKSGSARIDRDLTQAKTELARLAQKIETIKVDTERLDNAVNAAREETGRVASGLGEVRGQLDQQGKMFAKPADVAAAVTPVTGLISKIEGSLEDVLKKEEERQTSAERIVVSLELANLKRAIDRAQGFAGELEAVRSASGGRIALAPLEAYQDGGVLALADLKSTGRPALDAILDAGSTPEDASVWDRLLSGAKSVVRVRKVRHEGDENSLEATVARIEDALNAGRLADVIAEIDKLPPESRERISDWRDKVAARLSVDQAIAATEAELKAALVTSAGAAAPTADPATAPPAPPAGGAAPAPPAPPAGGADGE
ncbi:MAG: hypothetical protein R6X03_08275 [Methyloceanibacter sp.]